MGNPLGYGIVAVDPSVVPLGSKVYVTSADGSVHTALQVPKIPAVQLRVTRLICATAQMPTTSAEEVV